MYDCGDITRYYLSVCDQASRAGGNVLLEMLGKVTPAEKGPADLVTEADIASQEAVRRVVLDAFPEHGFLGEERTAEASPRPVAGGLRWIVDPLDGTTNFAHGVPHFAVSVALEEAGRLLVGAICNPVAGEVFTAVAGQGAWLNDRPIRTSSVTTLRGALAAIGFPPGVQEETDDLRAFLRALPRFQAIRRTGSASLNLAYVAAGRFDAAWSFATSIWDMAAGVLLVREAGGVASGPRGGALDLERGHFLATANEALHDQVRTLLSSV